jgi:hypothetical protein
VERAKIRLSDIRVNVARSVRLQGIEGLGRSIFNTGLHEPVMVTESDHTLLSGMRRVEACRRVNVQFVDAYFATNLREGAMELQRHLGNYDPLYTLPMSIKERVETAFLPIPSDSADAQRRDYYSASAIGLNPKIYAILRSTIRKMGAPDTESPSPGEARARKSLDLMVSAVENPG